MKIAITGGTGFVGSHLAEALVRSGHSVVIITRARPSGGARGGSSPQRCVEPVGIDDAERLARVLAGCDAVAHCAGINRETRRQTYQRVHIDGTRNVVSAACAAGVRKVVLLSFLRARPDCGSGYHESKWAAEQIVRESGLDYTILKAGVIYGRGDHMLDHLSHALHTFPIFALVGMRQKPVRPTAVEDVVRIMHAALAEGRLSRRTVAVVGPEEMMLGEAVRRVARVVGRRPVFFRAPVLIHFALAWVLERVMVIPMVSIAQVRILSEGIVEAAPPFDRLTTPPRDTLPADLAPSIRMSDEQIRRGLPEAKRFGWADCRCLVRS